MTWMLYGLMERPVALHCNAAPRNGVQRRGIAEKNRVFAGFIGFID
jgi:hypothetical protein